MRIVVVLFFCLAGCTITSQIQPFGQGTYTVTATSELGAIEAKQAALQKASEFCAQQGKTMQPVSDRRSADVEGYVGGGYGPGYGVYGGTSTINNYDLVFQCL